MSAIVQSGAESAKTGVITSETVYKKLEHNRETGNYECIIDGILYEVRFHNYKHFSILMLNRETREVLLELGDSQFTTERIHGANTHFYTSKEYIGGRIPGLAARVELEMINFGKFGIPNGAGCKSAPLKYFGYYQNRTREIWTHPLFEETIDLEMSVEFLSQKNLECKFMNIICGMIGMQGYSSDGIIELIQAEMKINTLLEISYRNILHNLLSIQYSSNSHRTLSIDEILLPILEKVIVRDVANMIIDYIIVRDPINKLCNHIQRLFNDLAPKANEYVWGNQHGQRAREKAICLFSESLSRLSSVIPDLHESAQEVNHDKRVDIRDEIKRIMHFLPTVDGGYGRALSENITNLFGARDEMKDIILSLELYDWNFQPCDPHIHGFLKLRCPMRHYDVEYNFVMLILNKTKKLQVVRLMSVL